MLPKTQVDRYNGSYFRLRHEIDSLLNDLQPPRLVVYVPLDQTRTGHALIELEAVGVVIQSGQQPPSRNTRHSVIACNALKPILSEESADDVENQVEAGKLSLADLDALADTGEVITKGVVSLTFGSGNLQDVALAFLASDRHDAEVEKKTAVAELAGLVAGRLRGRTAKWRATASPPVAACPLRPRDRPDRRAPGDSPALAVLR